MVFECEVQCGASLEVAAIRGGADGAGVAGVAGMDRRAAHSGGVVLIKCTWTTNDVDLEEMRCPLHESTFLFCCGWSRAA